MHSRSRKPPASMFSHLSNADDIFQNSPLPTTVPDQPSLAVLPKWMDETRLACFICGVFGLVMTILNLDFFYNLFQNPILINLSLLTILSGFVNCLLFPNLLKYSLVNGLRNSRLLKLLNGWMIVFSILLLMLLFLFPITGLGLALIIVPAPLTFALYSKRLC